MTAAVGPVMAEVRQRLLHARGNLDPLLAALDEIVRFVAILSGLAQENMTRGTGWRVPRSRTAARAGAVRARPALWAVHPVADRLGRRDVGGARAVRQHHHLPHALSRPAPARAGARPGDARRQQSALASPSSCAPSTAISTISAQRLGRARCRRSRSRSTTTSPPPCSSSPATSRSWRHEGLALAVLREIATDDRAAARRSSPRRSPAPTSATCRRRRPSARWRRAVSGR